MTFRRFGGDKLDRVAVRAPETETTRKLKSAARFTFCFETGPVLRTEIFKSDMRQNSAVIFFVHIHLKLEIKFMHSAHVIIL